MASPAFFRAVFGAWPPLAAGWGAQPRECERSERGAGGGSYARPSLACWRGSASSKKLRFLIAFCACRGLPLRDAPRG